MGELLDVVDEAEELPLPVDFATPPEGEAIEPFVVAQIPKHRLHGREALPVLHAALRGIDPTPHARRRGLGFWFGGDPAVDEQDLPRRGAVGRAEAVRALRTREAVALRAAKLRADIPVVTARPIVYQPFSP